MRLNRPTILDIAPTVLALNGLAAARTCRAASSSEALDLTMPAPVASYEPPGRRRRRGVGGIDGAVVRLAGRSRDRQEAPEPGLHRRHDRRRATATSPPSPSRPAASRRPPRAYARLVAEKPERRVAARELRRRARAPSAGTTPPTWSSTQGHRARAAERRGVPQPRRHPRAARREGGGDRDYQTAVRYNPQYEPSRQALAAAGRGDAPAPKRTPRSTPWRSPRRRPAPRAAATTRRPIASSTKPAASRRGLPLLYQYRANVAYLRATRAGAIAALEQGLKLEPDNALFRREPQAPPADSDREPLSRSRDAGAAGEGDAHPVGEAWRALGVARARPSPSTRRRLPHGLRRRQRRAADGDRRPRHPAPIRLSALRAACESSGRSSSCFLPLPWSMSLFSAACAAAASGVLYRTARESGAGPLRLRGSGVAPRVRPELLGRGQHPARLRAERALSGARALFRAPLAARPSRPGPRSRAPSSAASARRTTSRWESRASRSGSSSSPRTPRS